MRSTQEILELERTLLKLENLHASFDYLRISIASPKRIKSWAQRTLPSGEIVGEVIRPETVNFRTHQPELYGLFCEKIFGPIKNWKCRCGKYNGFAFDKICDECEVEITEARVRRYRMGYIELTCPIAHIWYVKGVPNYLAILLKVFDTKLVKCTAADISRIVYFQESRPDEVKINKQGIVVAQKAKPLDQFKHFDTTNNELDKFLTKNSLEEKKNSNGTLRIQKRKGSEIIKAALESINIRNEIKQIRSFLDLSSLGNLRGKHSPDKIYIRRIRILESFLATKTNPSWMVLTTLPVLPPNLRPLVELESGRLVTADANEIYRLIITRNQRLFDFLYRFIAPDLISIQGRKLLQESIDSLIDNSRVPKNKRLILNNKPLRSLTTILEGKPGRFRQSLLGKRVDYSGRSVIIVGPNLRLNQCGLPYEMAIELFQPFIIRELINQGLASNMKVAKNLIQQNESAIDPVLEKVLANHPIFLNRAPTLHRLGIQAFEPILVQGRAIKLHPLVCSAFNADFDGDQMAVHVPLSLESQAECYMLMLAPYNFLSPANGEPIIMPSQDMVLGCYYLTVNNIQGLLGSNHYFANLDDVVLAYYQDQIELHTAIWVRYNDTGIETGSLIKKTKLADDTTIEYYENVQIRLDSVGQPLVQYIQTTTGRVIFNYTIQKTLKLVA